MKKDPAKYIQSDLFHEMAMFVFDGANAVDVFGPLQVFNAANEIIDELGISGQIPYKTKLVSEKHKQIKLSTQTQVICDQTLSQLIKHPVNTFLIAGGGPSDEVAKNDKLVNNLLPVINSSKRVASICSGAFILADCGVLEHRKATTHWRRYEHFSRAYPNVNVEIDAIFTKDDKFYCSAGVTSGIDLALKLVEEDFGRRVALETAKEMVVHYHRSAGQSQYSNTLGVEWAKNKSLVKTQQWIHAHLDKTITVPILAEMASMSVRNFSRRFTSETGSAPSRYLHLVRLNQARLLLEEKNDPMSKIAIQCGFKDSEIMRRVFIRELNVAPSEYRARFSIIN